MKAVSGNILVVTYWSYQDALIQTYTLPYVKIISQQIQAGKRIYLVTLDKAPFPPPNDLEQYNITHISIPYVGFGLSAFLMWINKLFFLIRLIHKQKITTIHAWCTPAGMVGYILSVLTGKKLIIDSYEPHAEAMVENGEWKKGGIAHRLLFMFEKLQTRRAVYLIAASEGMKSYAQDKYNHRKNNFFVKPACVNLEMFSNKNIKKPELNSILNPEKKIIGVYAGKFGGIYLDQEVFDFFKVASDYWKGNFIALILTTQSVAEIEEMAKRADLPHAQLICKFVPHSEIPDYIGLADFALTPVKPVLTKRYCTPIKDGEYWALGLPIVITPDISDDSAIIETKKIGSIIRGFNYASYLNSIKEIDKLLKSKTREQLYSEIRAVAEEYRNFEIARNIYKTIYRS